MKWVLINNHKEPVQEYHLLESNQSKVILKYNSEQRSARISCANQQRLFFIQSTGALTGKYIFTNEYGMQIGHISIDKRNYSGGNVTIESKKYHYEISEALTIYDSNTQRPLVTCALSADNGAGILPFGKQPNSIDIISLILAHCWYLFLPVIKENILEYAV